MMSKMKLLSVAAVMAMVQATAAHATILNWSFTALSGLTGGGTFTANQDMVDPAIFHVTAATGTIGGEAVTLSGYDGADNKAFPTSPILVTSAGIGFSTASGFYNVYEFFTGVNPIYDCGALYCIEGPNPSGVTAQNISAAPNLSITISGGVPEPATWGLMILGFGVLGTVLRRRRSLVPA
jgi:hypothetical protein